MAHTPYSTILRPVPDGGFTVRVPAFPEIVAHGINEADALDMGRDMPKGTVRDNIDQAALTVDEFVALL